MKFKTLLRWEKFISRIYSSISQHIFITGSNAKLLSQEIATALRGRTILFEIYPFSFAEYTHVISPGVDGRSSAGIALLSNLFNHFLYEGGFPELIKQEEGLREKILQEYFNVMVFRDLIERYDISQPTILKYFCKRVLVSQRGRIKY